MQGTVRKEDSVLLLVDESCFQPLKGHLSIFVNINKYVILPMKQCNLDRLGENLFISVWGLI